MPKNPNDIFEFEISRQKKTVYQLEFYFGWIILKVFQSRGEIILGFLYYRCKGIELLWK